mgnify:CR=1 FL=1
MNQTKEKKQILIWPALLLLLLLLAPGNIVRVQAASDQTAVQLKLSQGIRRYDYAYQVLDLVNQERAKKNRNPVTMDKNLLECAMTRAEELTVCASHTRPNGSICFSAFPILRIQVKILQSTRELLKKLWNHGSNLPDITRTS